MADVNLKGFDIAQIEYWKAIKAKVEGGIGCKSCNGKLKMISKWRAECVECGSGHTIGKPNNFPKNMSNPKNWKATCQECGGKMDFHQGGEFGAYICRKCGGVLEV